MFGTYQRLGVSIHASDCDVIRAARTKLTRGAFKREFRDHRHEFYRLMLQYHAESRALYHKVMGGKIRG